MPTGIYTRTEKTKEKMSISAIKRMERFPHTIPNYTGRIHSLETKLKISKSKIGCVAWNKNIKGVVVAWNKGLKGFQAGEKHGRWIVDRSRLMKKNDRNDYAYKEWRKQVWTRDNWKCKIANQDCKGRIEAHHILIWSEYPELRYEINNGITLCHAHHPRKRAEEKQLIPYFMGLVETSRV